MEKLFRDFLISILDKIQEDNLDFLNFNITDIHFNLVKNEIIVELEFGLFYLSGIFNEESYQNREGYFIFEIKKNGVTLNFIENLEDE